MKSRTDQVRCVSLRQLLQDAEFVGAADLRIHRCCADSRRCRPGDLFVAIAGQNDDGHNHVLEAIRNGACAVLAERPVEAPGIPVCYAPNTRQSFGKICQALEGYPSRELNVIGITGTNGKSTTTQITAAILETAGFECGRLGTLGYFDGIFNRPNSWTTPPANVIAEWLGSMFHNGCQLGVLEVTSHALAQDRLADVELDVACFTNIRHDHLDYHGTLTKYQAAKARILENLRGEGVVIVNADDPGASEVAQLYGGPIITVGMEMPAIVSAVPLEESLYEQTFMLRTDECSVPIRTPLVGLHNISNCLVAAAVAMTYGVDLATIARGIESVRYIPGRMQPIVCGQPFSVIVDFAHTADALDCVLKTMRLHCQGRLICVFGAGGNRDRRKRPYMGRIAEKSADVIILTNDNPRHESPRSIMDDVLRGLRDPNSVDCIADRELAIRHALRIARPGDCVLIAGKGHEQYQEIEDNQVPFDDVAVAKRNLYQMMAMESSKKACA